MLLLFGLELERMVGLEHNCVEHDSEATQKAELEDGEQPTTCELFSLNPAMLEVWNLHLGLSVTGDNKLPLKPVWVRFSATCKQKKSVHSLES